jgi:predicted CXXCH cytochrome family protein
LLLLAAATLLALSAACTHRAPAAGAPPGQRVAEFTPIPDSPELHGANPHSFRGKPLCQRCHRPGEAGLTDEPVALCARCHDPRNMKHPTGVAQAAAPTDLPLAAGGRVVCHTCHDPHDVKAHKSGLRMEYAALCLRCHVRHGAKASAKP